MRPVRMPLANRQAVKLGVPHILVGLIAAGIAHEF